ncbi:hypothetical protein MRB53_038735 [Persea americana]|nr:hypothetical protein MRB53_038735 [Persea americana]
MVWSKKETQRQRRNGAGSMFAMQRRAWRGSYPEERPDIMRRTPLAMVRSKPMRQLLRTHLAEEDQFVDLEDPGGAVKPMQC